MNEKWIFDKEKAYKGKFVVEDLEFETYQTSYVSKSLEHPDKMHFWDFMKWEYTYDFPIEEVHKMNIKVPVRYKDVEFDRNKVVSGPMILYVPWGGDTGYPVSAVDSIYGPEEQEFIKVALQHGYIVVEPGMRGVNYFSGKNTGEDYECFAKIPLPIVDIKAAIRYLHYEPNTDTIPGDKERIIVAGYSAAGDCTTIIGTSGNAKLFEKYFDEIGAAPGRDDVYAVMPSAPVISRDTGDTQVAWLRWDVLEDGKGYDEMNVALTNAFHEYEDAVDVMAEFDVPEAGIKKGDKLTCKNLKPYIWTYVKAAGVKFLNKLGSREAIADYMKTMKPEFEPPYFTPETDRTWLKPVYESEDSDKVVDLDNTWDEYWEYVLGKEQHDPAIRMNLMFDGPIVGPREALEENGVVNAKIGPYAFSDYGNLSSYSFGKSTDFCSVFTDFGQKWIEEKYGLKISDEYKALYEMQTNAINPMYFIESEEEHGTLCKNWFLRSGALDFVIPWPAYFNLATKLKNKGCNVDVALVWDEGHRVTSETDEFFAFLENIDK